MKIGYVRVLTHDQNLDLQRDALEKAGCKKVLVDTTSGAASARIKTDNTRSMPAVEVLATAIGLLPSSIA